MPEKIIIEFGEPVFLNTNESMFIYADYWSSKITSLTNELLPKIYIDTLRAYEASPIDYSYLTRRCGEMGIEFETNFNKPVEENSIEENKEFKYKTKPYKHQVDGVNFGMITDRFLLGDEMGLGKTKQIIDLGVKKKIELGYKHCLIICCVNGLKWNWEDEISIHSDEKCHILGNRLTKKGKWSVKGMTAKLEDIKSIRDGALKDTYFIITNVEVLRDKTAADELAKLCEDNIIHMIAVDEMHKCATNSSQQSKGLLKLRTDSMVAMTGSPIMNNPLDLYMPLNWLGYDRHNFTEFKNHFCRFNGFNNITGFKNMEQIQNLLNIMMLRRLKKDVLDLPEKIFITEYVEMSSQQSKIYEEVVNDLRDQVDLIARSNNPLASLIRLRQATGHTSIISSTVSCSAKFDRCLELVKEYTDDGHKVIIFSNWTSMTDLLKVALNSYNPAIITGATKDRQGEKDRFMNDSNCKVFVGTIGAAGTGLTLTAADRVIFLDIPWTWANYNQACDRAHRIGAKNDVIVVNLVTKNTIDERIQDIVMSKKLVSEALIDQLDCLEITKLLNYLIN